MEFGSEYAIIRDFYICLIFFFFFTYCVVLKSIFLSLFVNYNIRLKKYVIGYSYGILQRESHYLYVRIFRFRIKRGIVYRLG